MENGEAGSSRENEVQKNNNLEEHNQEYQADYEEAD